MSQATPIEADSEGAVRRMRLLTALLFALVWIVYWPVGDNEFVNYDTPGYLTGNRLVNQGITWEGVKIAFTEGQSHLWHPLTTFSHMLDCELFGLEPRGHHLMNVGIHALTSALLIPLLFGLTRRMWPAVFAAAFFALHPLRVESVAWAAERKDTLAALFWILTIAAYARYVRLPSKKSYGALLAVFGLAMLTKPTIVTLPAALLLLDYWPLNRIRPGGGKGLSLIAATGALLRRNAGLFREKAPLVLGALFVCVMTIRAQRGVAIVSTEEISMALRLSNAVVSYVRYLDLTFWPDDLAVFYPFPENGWGGGVVALAAGLLAVVTGLAIRFRATCPYLAVGWLWFLGTLVPNIGLVQAGVQSMADRFVYIPSLGLAIMLAWGGADLAANRRWHPKWTAACGAAALVAMAMATQAQLSHWRNSVTLFTRALQVTEVNPVAHHNLATALLERGKMDGALEHFEAALRHDPGHVEANIGAAMIYSEIGRGDLAAQRYREALLTDPGNGRAANNLGNILVSMGRADEAIGVFESALARNATDPDTFNNLGLAFAALGQPDRAMDAYREAMALQPDHYRARQNLAIALTEEGDHEAAVLEFRQALRIKPDFMQAQAGLGIALRRLGRLDESIAALRAALELAPALGLIRSELVEALVRKGDYFEAAAQLGMALNVDQNDVESALRLGWIMAACPENRLRDGARAERLAVGFLARSSGKDPRHLDLKAAALAEQGRFADAALEAEQAFNEARSRGSSELASAIQNRLTLYRNAMPYRLENEFP